MFLNREDAAMQLAEKLKGRPLRHPLVLAIPRGGVVTGAVLARELGAELDVVLAVQFRARGRPDMVVGAVAEGGEVYLDAPAAAAAGTYLEEERRRGLAEIARRAGLFRAARPPAPVAGRSVIVADDGVVTGSTIIAALKAAKARRPHELIAAAPVAPPERLPQVRRWCDEAVCVVCPALFWAVGQLYMDFPPVEDERAAEILRAFAPAAPAAAPVLMILEDLF